MFYIVKWNVFVCVELKLKQCVEGLREQQRGCNTATCRSTRDPQGAMEHYQNSNNKPSLKETVDSLNKRMMEKRQEGLPDNIKVKLHIVNYQVMRWKCT